MTLEINLFGQFDIKKDGESIYNFSTDKVRALLAYLAVEHTRPIHRQQLSTLLWPDQTDKLSRHSLRQALSNLKQALNSEKYLLITSKTIQIQTDIDIQIDVNSFINLTNECEQHQHENLAHCLPCLTRQQKMLSLYRGEFLEHFPIVSAEPFEEWLLITREAMQQIALQALQSLIGFYERRGEFDQALKFSKKTTQFAPWNEEGYRETMRILASKGQRSQALQVYKSCKTALENEFSVPPSEETEILFDKIKDNRFDTIQVPPKPIPPITSFVGRITERNEIAELLSKPDCKLLTIVGAGGSGKTRLALQVVEEHAGVFSDGIYLTSLINVSNCTEAIQAIVQTLDMPPDPDPFSQLIDILKEKHLLLVLDNFEHLVNNCEVLSKILQAAPKIKLLITSRERLCLSEEWVFNIEGLKYASQSGEKNGTRNDAVELFIIRAKQVNQSFSLQRDVLKEIKKICTLVEGFPLGIELAASTIADQSCVSIANALSESLSAIVLPLRNLPTRHHSLQAAFEYSWNLLPENEQKSLAQLSIFAGAFTSEIAITVTDTTQNDLQNLAIRSLLKLSLDERYNFHQVIHQFARNQLNEPDKLKRKHAEYYAQWIRQLPKPISHEVSVEFLENRADILSAWKWILESETNIHLLHDLLPAISSIFLRSGPLSEGQSLLKFSIEKVYNQKSINHALAIQLTLALANINLATCDYEQVLQNANFIIENSALLHDHAQANLLLGNVFGAIGEPQKADSALQKALSYSDNNDDLYLKMNILNELSRIKTRNSVLDISIVYAQQALKIAQTINNMDGQALALSNLGVSYYYQGKTQEALKFSMQAHDLYIEMQDRRNEARMCNNLADIIAESGDLSRSIEYSQKALNIHTEMGNEQRKGFVLHNLGATYWELGDYEKARSTYLQTLRIYQTINIPHAEAEIYGNLALTEISLENLEMARQYIEKSIIMSIETEHKANLANAHQYLGRIALLMGNINEAEVILQKGMEIRAQIPHPARIAEYQIELAHVAYVKAEYANALEICKSVVDLAEQKNGFSGADFPLRIYYILWKILSANKQENAQAILANGVEILQKRAALITNTKYRKSFLENVEFHRKLITAYQTT